jgi:Ion channel
MTIVIGGTRKVASTTASRPTLRLIAVMIAAVLILMMAHVVEVLVWALSYAIAGVAPEGADRIYFAFVNYTTLGYGDIIPLERWRLVGPMTAMTGVLLFGWSTAVIFEVLWKVLELTEIRKDARP